MCNIEINTIREYEFSVESIRDKVVNDLILILKSNNNSVSIPKGFIFFNYDVKITDEIGEVYFYYNDLYYIKDIILTEDDMIELCYDNKLSDDEIAVPTDDLVTLTKIAAYLVKNKMG
jgi:hypothetical protein